MNYRDNHADKPKPVSEETKAFMRGLLPEREMVENDRTPTEEEIEAPVTTDSTKVLDNLLKRGGFPKIHRERRLLSDAPQEWTVLADRCSKRASSDKSSLMVLLGKSGCGKTQIATETARTMLWENSVRELDRLDQARSTPARYASAFEFILDLKATFRRDSGESERDVIASYAKPKLLVLDEFEIRGETEFEDRCLMHLLDRRYREGLSTIVLANLKRQEFEATLTESARTRMSETGGIVECNWKSFR